MLIFLSSDLSASVLALPGKTNPRVKLNNLHARTFDFNSVPVVMYRNINLLFSLLMSRMLIWLSFLHFLSIHIAIHLLNASADSWTHKSLIFFLFLIPINQLTENTSRTHQVRQAWHFNGYEIIICASFDMVASPVASIHACYPPLWVAPMQQIPLLLHSRCSDSTLPAP